MKEEKDNKYKTKNLMLAAFVRARGFELIGVNSIKNNKSNGPQELKEFIFADKNLVTKVATNYFMNSDVNKHNVNGKKLMDAYRELRSIISSL